MNAWTGGICKRPGRKPTTAQQVWIERVRAAGGVACVVSSVPELHAALQEAGVLP